MFQDLWDLVQDNRSVPGRLVTSAVVVGAGVAVSWFLALLLTRRTDDPRGRYFARKLARYLSAGATIVALAVVWRAFAGRVGLVLGFATAGLAFAMQEVIGAVAGWVNIFSGHVFRVGDRIQMGGVRGDVIDVTLLRTKLMEVGSGAADDGTWVKGRQFTGRVVSISNKATFTQPVFNYSASFDFLWEEITVPVSYESDWQRASDLIKEAAIAVSRSEQAGSAIGRMRRKYPIPPADLEPNVFAVPTDDYVQLVARFVVPVRSARTVKDELARQLLATLQSEGIEVASTTSDVRVRWEPGHPVTRTDGGDQDGRGAPG